MDDLINEFLAETREMLQALSGAIVAWEKDPGDRARLDEIFRFVHTVKGNCGFFDLPRLQKLSHAAEDVLAEVRSSRRSADSRLVSAVLAVIDRIGELAQALESGASLPSGDDSAIIAALAADAPVAEAEARHGQAVPAPEAKESRTGIRSIRLSIDLLDRMMNGVSDAVLARNELARRLRDCDRDVAVETAFERVSACIAEIRDSITRTRMQRIDSLFTTLPRMVRDLSNELKKQVHLQVDGGDVELDREMIDMIRDPLSHIVRNSIDHGIEPAEKRQALGKNPVGSLKVSARQSGNQILIEVVDDGRGIDGEGLARRAVSAGILAVDRAEALTDEQKAALIFSPGLSTAGKVTAISGRGVGMDVVRANIERVGGVTDVQSTPGQGVRLSIRVPLTLTIIPALTVSAGGQVFAIPRSAIEEILRSSGGSVRIDRVGESTIATIRGRRMPLVCLPWLLGIDPASSEEGRKVILLKPAGGDVYALFVDEVHDHEELVVKPAAPAVMAAGLYAGTTLADDGRPILLLDPSGMAKKAGIRLQDMSVDQRLAEPAEEKAADPETTILVFRGLDGGTKAVPVSVIERIEDVPVEAIAFSAGRRRVSVNGRILALAGETPPEGQPTLRILRLTDGQSELAYGFGEVVDIRSLVLDPSPAAGPGEIAGVALVEGIQVELLDIHWLFAAASGARRGEGDRPVCALPKNDPWMTNMLEPLIESLGYRVVAAGEGVRADILIASAEGPDQQGVTAAEILKIRCAPEQSGENDNSIYRYDRQALVSALTRNFRSATNG